jgi:uncharacterized membrane protein YeaQ/YmgE (transglycosylase-associated protein family)
MHLIGTLLIGLIVGVIAKLLMPGKDPGGWIICIVLGLAGAFLAGFLGRSLGWYAEGEPAGFVFSVVGAMILLGLYRAFNKNRAGTTRPPLNR